MTAYAEVSNTLKVPYVTGIQRTARKLVEHWPEGHPVRLVPVVTGRRRFRTLLDGERAALRTEPSGAEPVSITRGGWRAVARKVPGARGVRDGLVAARGAVDEVRRRPLGIDPGPGDVLLDLEATWWSSADRAQLLPELRARGVRVATLVYDLMLLRNPEWFDPQNRAAFEPWARAQLRHAELALCTSEFVAREIAEFGAPDPPATAVVPLGSDPVDVEPRRPSWLPDDGREFVVCVGTIADSENVGHYRLRRNGCFRDR